MGQADKVQRHLKFLDAPSCVIAYQLDGQAVGDSWKTIICILNANRTPQQVIIPDGDYTIVVRDGVVNAEGLGHLKGRVVTVPAQSAMIMKK